MLVEEAKTQIGLHTLVHVNVFSAIFNLGGRDPQEGMCACLVGNRCTVSSLT
jgi:hypothetical protein